MTCISFIMSLYSLVRLLLILTCQLCQHCDEELGSHRKRARRALGFTDLIGLGNAWAFAAESSSPFVCLT